MDYVLGSVSGQCRPHCMPAMKILEGYATFTGRLYNAGAKGKTIIRIQALSRQRVVEITKDCIGMLDQPSQVSPPSRDGSHSLDIRRTPDAAAGPERDLNVVLTDLDRAIEASVAQFSFGLSPAALTLAYADWAIHLAAHPGLTTALAAKAWRKSL
eukprot:gene33805-39412_t